MALKLLNPGLRPLGMFDLDDNDVGQLVGGEYVELQAVADVAASDVGGLLDSGGTALSLQRTVRTAGQIGGLADEGGAGDGNYGTLFGTLVGATAGRTTSLPGGGFTLIGPTTDAGSGKATVWAAAGLYGVTGSSIVDGANAVNTMVQGTAATGLLIVGGAGSDVGIYVGDMDDTSLVSTTTTALGLGATVQYNVVFYTGNAQA